MQAFQHMKENQGKAGESIYISKFSYSQTCT